MSHQDLKFTEDQTEELTRLCPGEFDHCEFRNIKFTNMSLRSSLFMDCQFDRCHLAGQDLLNCVFRDVHFNGCHLVGINWASLKRFENCHFHDCKLDLASFQGLKMKKIKITACSLKETDFAESVLSEADFSDSDLLGAVFTRADLSKADLRTAKSYYIEPAYTKLKGAKVRMPEAITFLTALGVEVEY